MLKAHGFIAGTREATKEGGKRGAEATEGLFFIPIPWHFLTLSHRRNKKPKASS
jgi:hypothetical protein